MKRRHLLAAGLALAAAPAFAQTSDEKPAAPPPVRVKLSTAEGDIVIALATAQAPITTANFLRYVDTKRYDGASFYRVSRAPGAPQYGLIQGGLNGDPKKVMKPIAHEPTSKTGLSHKDGTISMGRFAPGTATSDFFIMVGDAPEFDADPKAPGDNQGFAAFGQVVEGMDVVKKILALPQSPTGGTGAMKGEMLKAPVKILAARRVD
ncbi:peptidylprolyl isomerase [Phenylobacterium sp.]|uniref:peptidylprolyl isomerase n=1 Tax=Phenylobacterium sp. TaxID=1871053 RepID=UPI0035B0215A